MKFETFVKERDEALLSLDKEKIINYCKKYGVDMPQNDKVLFAATHKAILHIKGITEEQRKISEKWLIEQGFTTEIGRGAE